MTFIAIMTFIANAHDELFSSHKKVMKVYQEF